MGELIAGQWRRGGVARIFGLLFEYAEYSRTMGALRNVPHQRHFLQSRQSP